MTAERIRRNAFLKNSAVIFVGTVAAGILNYFFHLAVGRMVDARVFGEMESLVSLVNIFSVPAAAIVMSATQYGARAKAADNPAINFEVIKYFYRKLAGYGLPLFAAFLFITPWVGNFLKIENNLSIAIVWGMIFLSLFSSVNGGIVNGWQKFGVSGLIGFLGASAKIISAIILVKAGLELSGAIGGFAIGVVVSYFGTYYAVKCIKAVKRGTAACSLKFEPIKGYVTAAFVGNLAINILGNADMVLAKHNLDPVQAGQYGALTAISKTIFFIAGIVATVLFSMAAEDSRKGKNSIEIFKSAFFLTLAVSFTAVAIYFAFPKLVIGMLFGSRYLGVGGYLGWFAVLAALFSLSNLVFQYPFSIRDTSIAGVLLGVSFIFCASVLFFAKSIQAILLFSIAAQAVAIFFGVCRLLTIKKTCKFNFQ